LKIKLSVYIVAVLMLTANVSADNPNKKKDVNWPSFRGHYATLQPHYLEQPLICHHCHQR